MSIKLMSRVWDSSPYTHTMLLLHVAMADAANDEGEFHYKQETLAKKARVSVRYLRDVTQRMVEDGYLEVQKMRWGRLTYRLLTPQEGNSVPVDEGNSVPVGPELSSGNRGTQFRSQGNSVPVTTEPSTEPSEEPSEEPTTPAPSGLGGREDASMRAYGQDPDDEQEMPEGRMGPDDYERPERKPKPKFESVPKENTQPRAMYEWGQGVARLRGRSTQGVIRAAIRDLHGEGYSYAEITMLIETFFLRYEHEIRGKRTEIDAGVMFRQRVPQLLEQTESKIRDKRAGRESSLEYNTRLGQERLAPMREWIENRKGRANA